MADDELDLPLRRRSSNMRLEFTVSIGYTRLRPGAGVEDTWEAHVGTLGLLITGAVVAIIIIWIALPRILDAIGHV